MNRKESLKFSWIPITKRLPPDIEELVEVWNYVDRKTMTLEGFIARLAAETLLELEGTQSLIEEKLSWDRRISHWRPMVGPK